MIGEVLGQMARGDILFALAVPATWWLGWMALARYTSAYRPRTTRTVAVLLVLRYELSLLAGLGVVAATSALGLGPFARGGEMIGSGGTWLLAGFGGAVVVWLGANRSRWREPLRTRLDRRTLVHATVLAFDAVAEEIIYRGLLFVGLLAILPTWAAAGTSAIAFGVAHFPVGGWRIVALHTVTGLGFCLLVVASGGLAASIVAHVTYNLLVVFERRASARGPAGASDPTFAPSFAPTGGGHARSDKPQP